jgi:hypothetical protein
MIHFKNKEDFDEYFSAKNYFEERIDFYLDNLCSLYKHKQEKKKYCSAFNKAVLDSIVKCEDNLTSILINYEETCEMLEKIKKSVFV